MLLLLFVFVCDNFLSIFASGYIFKYLPVAKFYLFVCDNKYFIDFTPCVSLMVHTLCCPKISGVLPLLTNRDIVTISVIVTNTGMIMHTCHKYEHGLYQTNLELHRYDNAYLPQLRAGIVPNKSGATYLTKTVNWETITYRCRKRGWHLAAIQVHASSSQINDDEGINALEAREG